MLVLSRKAGERINIGNNITVEVRRVAGNRVTIALHAPKEVRILRGELKQAVEAFEDAVPEDVAPDVKNEESPNPVSQREFPLLEVFTAHG